MEAGREGGREEKQEGRREIETTDMNKTWRRRERGGSSTPLLLILTFEIDWLELAVNQHLRVVIFLYDNLGVSGESGRTKRAAV